MIFWLGYDFAGGGLYGVNKVIRTKQARLARGVREPCGNLWRLVTRAVPLATFATVSWLLHISFMSPQLSVHIAPFVMNLRGLRVNTP